MNSVYIESTIPSYLTAQTSANLVASARILLTQKWWESESQKYQLYISDVVLAECTVGDPAAVARRSDILRGLPVLENTGECQHLAEAIYENLRLPAKAKYDAFHLAIACYHEVDYLLSWNFKHIVNASLIRKLREITEAFQYELPQICTPEELI
jgi:hypothetical protein